MIAKSLAEAKQVTNDEDVKTWVWLTDVLEWLERDGMSSDESVADNDIHMVYQTKVMPWRRDIYIHTQRVKAGQKDTRKR